MRRGWSILAALAFASSSAAAPDPQPQPAEAPVRYDGHKVVRVPIHSLRDLRLMQQFSQDTWVCGPIRAGLVDFRVEPDTLPLLDAAGIQYEVVIPDVQALIDAERAQIEAAADAPGGLRGPDWFETYHTYGEISQYVNSLVALRPDLATRFAAGESLQGLEIFGVRMTSPKGTNKPAIFLNCLQHAREWITGAAGMYIADKLVRGYGVDPVATEILDAYEVYIVPVSNPDGYSYTWTNARLWRKNRRPNANGTFGVDTNRNWGYQWGGQGASADPGNETYRGTGPFSEPETQALRNFIAARPNIVMSVDIHSFSQLILSAWGYTAAPPPNAIVFAEMNARIEAAMESVDGQNFTAGPTYTTIYPASGVASDWAYGERQIWGWGFELRPASGGNSGFILPAEQIVPASEECWQGVLAAARYLLDNALYFGFPDGRPQHVAAFGSDTITVEVRSARLPLDVSSVRAFSRIGRTGAFTEASVTHQGNQIYSITLPTGPCHSVVQYYIEARTTPETGAIAFTSPPGGASEPYEAESMMVTTIIDHDFESDQGWTAGAPGDTATSGIWVRVNPNGTIAQPEDAHSPTMCYVTGQGPVGGADGAADVDDGYTTLLSPIFDLSGAAAATISYWRWYSNTAGAAPASDVFVVDISADGGSTWSRLETVGPGGPGNSGGWIYAEHTLPGEALTGSMRLRFIAEDAGAGSLIEAALDDVLIRAAGCPGPACASDWDRNGVVNSGDISFFLAGWVGDVTDGGSGHDFNADGSVNSTDISAFLTDWLTGVLQCGA